MSAHAQTNQRSARTVTDAGTRSTPTAVVAARKPVLLFFHSATSGRSRRVEGFLAQVLQRRRNHGTFTLHWIEHESRPDLAARFGVEQPPAIVVVDGKRVRARLEQPRGCLEIKAILAPWLK